MNYSLNNGRVDLTMSRVSDWQVIIKKAYAAQAGADAKYYVTYVDPDDTTNTNTFTDTVNGNGTVYVIANGNYLTVPAGKEFDHWELRYGYGSSISKSGSYAEEQSINVSSNLTFEAVWKPREYTVHFNSGSTSATGTMDDETTGINYMLPECGFTAPTDKEFYKWKYDGELYDPGDVITIQDGFGKKTEITLTAVWQSTAANVIDFVTITDLVSPVAGNLPAMDYEQLADSHVHLATADEIAQATVDYWAEHDYSDYPYTTAKNAAESELLLGTGWFQGVIYSGDSYYTYDYRSKYGFNEVGTSSWQEGTPFEAGGKYRIQLYIAADDGYVFADDTSVDPKGLVEGTDYDKAETITPSYTTGG